MKKIMETWKYPFVLLVGIGIANVGGWIYLIALNLIIFDMTGSALAVAALYIIKPVAALVTNSWSGSLIDRLNKRNLMVFLDLSRAIIIVLLPSLSTLWVIYILVFFINAGSAVFEHASMSYITRLIPPRDRKRFNSFRSLVDSGGFLIGPAIAGMLFLVGSPEFSIYINAVALFLSGLLTLVMPDVEEKHPTHSSLEKLSLASLKQDFHIVKTFSKRNVYMMVIYFLFSSVMVMTAAIDSLEAAFSKEVLSLSNEKYGFLVSIAGAGIVVGAVVNALFVKSLSTSILIGGGTTLLSVGYIIYAFSHDFFGAALGFFLLSFALAFANTGFYTFYQQNVPVEIMGRIGSVYGLIEAMLVIISTTICGIAVLVTSIQSVVIVGSLTMLTLSVILLIYNLIPLKGRFYTVN